MQSSYKISVIVPLFNAENFIDKCIKSLIEQTYQNLELIFINDGSTDKTLQILRHYQILLKDVIVVNKINEGPGIARNVGLDIASGDFVMFLDADDYITNRCCETVVEYIKISDADFVCFGANFFSKENKLSSRFSYTYKEICGQEILINYFTVGEIKSVVWNKLYRKNTIDRYSIRFPINRVNEDALFVMKMALHSKFVKLVPGVFYSHTSCNSQSFTNNVLIEHFLSSVEVLNEEKRLLCEKSMYSSLERPYKIHSAKLLTYLILLGSLKLNRHKDFLICLSIIYKSDIWVELQETKIFELPLAVSFRVWMCSQHWLCWKMGKTMRRLGVSL